LEKEQDMIPAVEALRRLQEGNRQFIEGKSRRLDEINEPGGLKIIEDQKPFAVILGCSDSRVPVEIVFNQGFGDLFVIRVAGNIVAPSQIGSIEFAAEKFGTRLVVVMGHTHCGAVQTTLDELMRPGNRQSRNLRSIVDRIRPAVEGLVATELREKPDLLMQIAIRTNISISANFLRHGSERLEQLIESGELLVVGAEYSIETGRVEFFDGLPGEYGPDSDLVVE
jgi:carbonic anhydrase